MWNKQVLSANTVTANWKMTEQFEQTNHQQGILHPIL